MMSRAACPCQPSVSSAPSVRSASLITRPCWCSTPLRLRSTPRGEGSTPRRCSSGSNFSMEKSPCMVRSLSCHRHDERAHAYRHELAQPNLQVGPLVRLELEAERPHCIVIRSKLAYTPIGLAGELRIARIVEPFGGEDDACVGRA